ncbi:TATA-binding protein-associated factor 2N-like isoform X1 [Cucurbita pepo subsp. pepo]|uniref:TATA-binding protein-associated factor 2N-like isoform X1 n=1 Tax=Cucurbita pepo subsp. pepo TaxID=3664 RepID=UPI000C9D87AC|nr:TATA-binding protein-associated factor 2N-like isoform X1 [Cucurbita pepo subsp. pepo]
MNRPGDWNCRSCQHLNFQRRECCQRCGESRFLADLGLFGGGGGGSRGRSISSSSSSSYGGVASPGSDVRPGDWYCGVANCGTHNFANRSSCFVCGAFKDESAATAAGGGFDFDVAPRGSRTFGFGSNGSRGPGATYITLQVEWSVFDAMLPEIHSSEISNFHQNYLYFSSNIIIHNLVRIIFHLILIVISRVIVILSCILAFLSQFYADELSSF